MLNGSIVKNKKGEFSISLTRVGTDLKTWFFLLPAFKLAILESYPVLDKMYSLWGFFSLSVLAAIGIIHERIEKKALLYASFMVGFCAIYSFMTLVYTTEAFLGSVSQSVRMLLFPFYVLAYRNANFKEILTSLSSFLKAILILDSASIFVNYDGKIQYSLLGLDNTVIFLIIPILTIIMFNDHYSCGKFSASSLGVFLLCFIGKLYSQAVTACFAMVVFVLAYYIVLSKKRNFIVRAAEKVINPTVMFGVFVLFTAMTILFDLTPLFSAVFSVFGKDGTLSGRTRIWALSVDSIFRNPIVGYGQAYPEYFQKIVGLSVWDKAATHTHNYALELLWSSGIIGTFMFMYLFVMAIRKLYEYRYIKSVRLLSCGFTAFCVLMITDSYIMQPSIMILCFLCLNIEKILIQKITKGN